LKQANRRIYEAAKSMPDPEARRAFVEREIAAAKEQARVIVERIRRGAAQRDQDLTAEVDNMDFDDELLDDLEFGREDVIDETERRVGPSGRKFDRSVGPAPAAVEDPVLGPQSEVGEVESAPAFTFGKHQKQPAIDVSGESTVVGYDTREQAEKGIATLLNEIPNATRQDFDIKPNENGSGFVVETKNPDFREDITYNERFAKARRTAQKDNPKDSYTIPKRVYEGRDDTKLTNPKIHVPTMAYAGMKLEQGITSLREGMAAMAAKMMERGDLDTEAAQELMDKFDEIYPPSDPTPEVYAPVTNYQSKNAATAAMLKIADGIKDAFDIQFAWPKNMLSVRDNGDGTFSFGITDPRAFRALRKKNAKQAAAITAAIKAERRVEKLSGEPIGPGGRDTGVSADPRGTFAGDPDVEVAGTEIVRTEQVPDHLKGQEAAPRGVQQDFGDADPNADRDRRLATARQRAESLQDEYVAMQKEGASQEVIDANRAAHKEAAAEVAAIESELTTGNQFPTGDPRVTREQKILQETRESQQTTDQKTDPAKQESEFETRNREETPGEPGLSKPAHSRSKNRTTPKTAKQPQTEADNKLLKTVFGRVGKVKVMMTQKTKAQQKMRTAVRDLVTFTRNTLGLKNSVVVMDDSGLAYMIENGLVSDPVFKQTLENPNVHARNIRIGDTSYIYLSDGLSKNRAMAVLALGHEMGHHLYSVAWDNLSQDGRNRLREAFDKSPAGKVIAQELLDAQATNDPEG
ncbi:MAG: hypothetical protein ACYS7Y_34870, partial [Planctomycetota bacterium]